MLRNSQEEMIGVFTAPELQLLCCGTQTVDWRELQAAATYEHDESVQWFWQTVEDMTQPEVSTRPRLDRVVVSSILLYSSS
jgi:hypothetical protein